MKFGVGIPNCRHLATPEIIRGAAVRAKMISSLDALSGGRVVFGIGA
jgi:alkanesulfonate monooxygenase SsuD/methylene tetrahydromethanopterin reductase-like flavin-dependent oxidoreductase (luciferase family)